MKQSKLIDLISTISEFWLAETWLSTRTSQTRSLTCLENVHKSETKVNDTNLILRKSIA